MRCKVDTIYVLYHPPSWRRDVVVKNEVTVRRAGLVLGWAGAPSRYVTSQLGQLSLASLPGC